MACRFCSSSDRIAELRWGKDGEGTASYQFDMDFFCKKFRDGLFSNDP